MMRIGKVLMVLIAVLALMDSVCVAEMTAMSLGERMGLADLVAIGTILEVHKTPIETETGTEHWLASCRIERFIIEKKKGSNNVEDGKSVSLISIAFVQLPLQTPAPIKLSEGKRYLLFLKEAGPQEGRVVYKMITPYHGAFEDGQEYLIYDERDRQYPQAIKATFEEIVKRLIFVVDIREQIDTASVYWYAYFREKMLGKGLSLRNVRQEGEWTKAEVFGYHVFVFTPFRLLTRFLAAEEAQIEGQRLVFNAIKSLLRSSDSKEIKEGVRELNILCPGECGNMNEYNLDWVKDKCLNWLKDNGDFLVWNETLGLFRIDGERKAKNLPRPVRGLQFSIKTDKTMYNQDEPIKVTFRLENVYPPSGRRYSVLQINARMLIHSELVVDIRNERGEYYHFLPEPPPVLEAKDFKRLDGGEFIESQEEITSLLHEKPLNPGWYQIQATYQNYELARGLLLWSQFDRGLSLLEGGPAWTGRIFSNTIAIEIKEKFTPDLRKRLRRSQTDESLQLAKQVLFETNRITSANAGEMVDDPAEIVAFNVIYHSDQAAEIFKEVYKKSRSAGKFYALIGLYLLKDREFKNLKTDFLNNEQEKVYCQYGCEASENNDVKQVLDIWLEGIPKGLWYTKIVIEKDQQDSR